MSGNKDTLAIDNSTAGMADAYWYEWYVGLDNILDMLNTKNNIDHVILQHEKLQGLDDVVVIYTDKTAKCIQVKHTRTGEKISFSDLVYFTQNKESLLKKTAKDWLRARELYGECNAILYTNRKAGSDYEVKMRNMNNYIRPDLKIFYETLKIEISKMNELKQFSENHQEWDVAWNEWCTQLECIKKESDRIEFIKCLEIKTEEKDLKETVESVVHKLEESFDISNSIARQLEMKLCYALRTWTTSLRQRQEITKEKLYEALSINDEEEIGVHDITPQEPIFKSRTEFANNLSNTLAKREKPVIFLNGEPGCGKTNVVSDLAQRSESVISLRFYTFKPLTLKDNYLSPDGGIYEARSLWGNLLIGLRRLLKGNLEKYNVPPVNAFLDTIEKMRSKVLELAQCLAKLTGETTVIAIDGIDHAVRSGESSSYLKTLPEPELIPDNVCFLIAGQLMTNTDYYPDWLTDENRVLQCEVPAIDENDIDQIYNYSDIKLPIENKSDIIRLINNRCSGNTLAIMFAIKEAEKCNNVDELEEVFNNKRLSEGITEYYEYVWKNAIKNIPKEYAYLENILAGVLSLLNKHITPEMLVEICNELSINKYIWKNVLDSLFPIIVRNKESYSAYHNDIRVYLEKRIKRNLSNYQEANCMIAEYLFCKCKDTKLVHENVFRFLLNANRESDFAKVFTYPYVYDAIKNKRPWNEIINQLNITLKSVQNSFCFEGLVSLTCSVSTLFQYKETLNWLSKQHIEEKKLPELLNSEKKVYNKKFWTLDRIETLFSDLFRLIEFGEMERANVLYERWLDNINPEQLYDLIIINPPEYGVIEEVDNIIGDFGFICRYIGIKFQIPNTVNDNLKESRKKIRGCFSKGWLEAGSNLYTEKEVEETIRLIIDLKIVKTKSFEEYFNKLVKNNVAESLKISHYPICDKFSCTTKIDFLVTAIIYKKELPQKWIEDILKFGITYVDRGMFLGHDFLTVFCKLIFVLEYLSYPFEKDDSLIEYFYLGRNISQDEISIFISIIKKYKYLASFFNTNERKEDTDVIIFERYVYDTFDYNIKKMRIFNIDVEKNAIEIILRIAEEQGNEYIQIFLGVCVKMALDKSLTHIEYYWEFLKRYNHMDLLEELFDYWMLVNGEVWKEDLDSMYTIAVQFIDRAKQLGWLDKVNEVEILLSNKLVGYVGRKEYSLFLLESWYEKMDIRPLSKLNKVGYEFFKVSEKVSAIADNRCQCSILTKIAESAGLEGYISLWNFALLNNKQWNTLWIRAIYDGIIAAFEKDNFSKEDLMCIWDSSAKLLPTHPKIDGLWLGDESESELNHIYICDVRDGIILAAKRLGYENIEKDMQQLIQANYNLKTDFIMYNYIYPSRWFGRREIGYDKLLSISKSDTKEEKSIDLIFHEYEEKKLEAHGRYTDNLDVNALLENLKKMDENSIRSYIPTIVNYIIELPPTNGLSENSTREILDLISRFIGNDTFKVLLNKIIEEYFTCEETIEGLCFQRLYYSLQTYILCFINNVSSTQKLQEFKTILNMHIDWISGFGSIPFKGELQSLRKEPINQIKSWRDFILHISTH